MRNLTILSALALLSASCTRGPHYEGPSDPQADLSGPSGMPMGGGADPHAGMPVGPGAGGADPHAGMPMGGGAPAGAPRGGGEPVVAGPPPAFAPAIRPAAGGVTWTASAPLVGRRPSSGMRAAEYGIAGQDPDAQLAVFYFGEGGGGGVQANVDRWVAQFTQPDGSPSGTAAHVTTRTVAGMRVTLIDLTGTFGGGMPGMPGASAAKPNYRLLGAIAEGPHGAIFFKLTGPQAALTAAEPAFQQLVGSLEVVQGG